MLLEESNMNGVRRACKNNVDMVSLAVARVGMSAGMIVCAYAVYRLLKLLNAPEFIQLILCFATLLLIGHCFIRYEAVLKRLGQLEN
jgi:hypothetical protein